MKSNYFYDEHHHLFRRPAFQGISYSDGAYEERRICEIIKCAENKSVFSQELFNSIESWASEYHLSRSRHCLIRPLKVDAHERILELGCGCGAITRYLGEVGCEVVAVEGSLTRAGIAALRCEDLPNVSVYLDDVSAFVFPEKFDRVFMIGVLEYSNLFSNEQNPSRHYLRVASEHLNEDGELVIAIENRLGLKYFNGCSEDHVGVPFFGVQDLYTSETARTLGRREIISELRQAGFEGVSFYYPFPDYKLPSIIIHESAFEIPEFSIPDLLLRVAGRDYGGAPYRLFNEALVYKSLYRNGVLEDFSNSFLIVAKKKRYPARDDNEIAWNFSVQRRPEFCTQTSFHLNGSRIEVQKTKLLDTERIEPLEFENGRITLDPGVADYIKGELLLWRFIKLSQSRSSFKDLARSLAPWLDLLLECSHVRSAGNDLTNVAKTRLRELYIHGDMIDCAPFNIIRNSEGIHLIDTEWRIEGDLPLGFVLTRGVLGCVLSTFTNSVSADVFAIVGALCELRNITVEHDDLIRWLEMEESFQQLVTGKDSHECDFSAGSYISLLDELHHQKNRMIDLEALLAVSRRSEEPEISLCLVNHGIAQSVDLAVIEASSNLEADDDSPEDEEFVNSQTEESNVQEVKISAGLQPAGFQ